MSKLKLVKDKDSHGFKMKKKGKRAELTLYGTVGEDWFGEGITAAKVVEELKNLKDVEELEVRINSMGGDVFDGLTIYNRLRQYNAKITVYVDGLAASIASIIAMAGDEIIISEGSLLMVHSPMTGIFGNQRDMQEKIEILDTIEEEMIGIYARKSGMGRTEIRNLLHNETWMNAQESLEYGFATSISEDEAMVACSDDAIKMFSKKYKNCPSTIITESKLMKQKLEEINNKIEDYIAR